MREIALRRSIRQFEERPVERELLERLARAGMQAPSACNQQPWEFLFLTDRAMLDALSQVSTHTKLLKGAPAALALLGDKRRMTRPQMWQQDLSACTENVLLEAVSLGLGAVWMGVAPIEERMETVRRILELPDWMWPFNLVAIGYPRGGENGFVDRYQPSRVHFERLDG